MLKKQMERYIENVLKMNGAQVALFEEEKRYVENHPSMLGEHVEIIEKNGTLRFADAYIERCDKESEEMLAEEKPQFLQNKLSYLKQHKNEFIYVESDYFDIIGVDVVSLEVDDVFGTYNVMVGLKLQKKHEAAIKSYLSGHLEGEGPMFGLMFSQGDGLWDLNFTLNGVAGFTEDATIEGAYRLIYSFIFQLQEAVEAAL